MVLRVMVWLRGDWLECWSSNMSEGDSLGHLDGHSSSKSTDLLMDVGHEGDRSPSALLLDSESADAMKVHCHSTTSTEGVAADVISGVAKVVEANEVSCIFESLVDLVGVHKLESLSTWVLVVEEVCSGASTIG